MSEPTTLDSFFPALTPKRQLRLATPLDGQIYTIDGFLTKDECEKVLKWIGGVKMDGPKKPGRGEAERTASRGSVDSPYIASALLPLLVPHLSQLDPPPLSSSSPLLSPNIRIYHYPPTTYFRGHYDTPQLDPASRRLSCWTVLIYLSSGVSGGGTIFWLDDDESGKGGKSGKGKKGKADTGKSGQGRNKITIEPRQGRACLHWHGVAKGGCMLHEGDEVISGDKWVLRTDVLA